MRSSLRSCPVELSSIQSAHFTPHEPLGFGLLGFVANSDRMRCARGDRVVAPTRESVVRLVSLLGSDPFCPCARSFDIVGYSKLLTEEQGERLDQLTGLVLLDKRRSLVYFLPNARVA